MSEQHKTILFVDDEPELIHGATMWFRAAGYDMLQAGDGEQGVNTALEQHPDAIVLDVRMPRKDGLTALLELKERDETRDIPVVMLSASIVDQQAALDAGARFFISKPYNGKELVDAVNVAMSA